MPGPLIFPLPITRTQNTKNPEPLNEINYVLQETISDFLKYPMDINEGDRQVLLGTILESIKKNPKIIDSCSLFTFRLGNDTFKIYHCPGMEVADRKALASGEKEFTFETPDGTQFNITVPNNEQTADKSRITRNLFKCNMIQALIETFPYSFSSSEIAICEENQYDITKPDVYFTLMSTLHLSNADKYDINCLMTPESSYLETQSVYEDTISESSDSSCFTPIADELLKLMKNEDIKDSRMANEENISELKTTVDSINFSETVWMSTDYENLATTHPFDGVKASAYVENK